MKLVKNRYFQLLIAFFALGAVFFAKPVFALEPNYELPSMLWGRASVTTKPGTSESMVYFSQPQATMAIRNTAPGFLLNFEYSVDCLLGITDTNISCFKFSQPSDTKVLNSKTYVNEVLKSAVAALKYPPVNVTGSTYSVSDLGDFAYWGRHLRQTGDNYSRNAFWQAMDYQFNPAAQAVWTGSNQTVNNTIDRISADAKDIGSIASGWSAPVSSFHAICGLITNPTPNNCSELNQYPEGRSWIYHKTTDLEIRELHYYNRATVIIENANLILDGSIISQDDLSNLGFIVRNGDVTISNPDPAKSIKINASFFVPNGTIRVPGYTGYNITLTGSFVAKDFDISDTSGSNINFVQDTRGENAWPPGFRELQLPIILNK